MGVAYSSFSLIKLYNSEAEVYMHFFLISISTVARVLGTKKLHFSFISAIDTVYLNESMNHVTLIKSQFRCTEQAQKTYSIIQQYGCVTKRKPENPCHSFNGLSFSILH